MSAPIRTALFLLSLVLLLATATPAAWGRQAEPSGPSIARSEVVAIAGTPEAITARRISARFIQQWHEEQGHEQWRNGIGDPQYTWALFKRQARQLRTYLLSQKESIRRFALVANWSDVARCESGGDWAIDTGNGYYGGLQFSVGTWRAYGGSGMPQHQPAWVQAQIADNVRRQSGLHHWPVCGSRYR